MLRQADTQDHVLSQADALTKRRPNESNYKYINFIRQRIAPRVAIIWHRLILVKIYFILFLWCLQGTVVGNIIVGSIIYPVMRVSTFKLAFSSTNFFPEILFDKSEEKK